MHRERTSPRFDLLLSCVVGHHVWSKGSQHAAMATCDRRWSLTLFIVASACCGGAADFLWSSTLAGAPKGSSHVAFSFARHMLEFAMWAVADIVLDVVCDEIAVPMGNWHAQLPQRFAVYAAAPLALRAACDAFGSNYADYHDAGSLLGVAVVAVVGGLFAQRDGLRCVYGVESAVDPAAPYANPDAACACPSTRRSVARTLALNVGAFAVLAVANPSTRLAGVPSAWPARMAAAVRLLAVPAVGYYAQAACFVARTSPDLVSPRRVDFPRCVTAVRWLSTAKLLVSLLRQVAAWSLLLTTATFMVEHAVFFRTEGQRPGDPEAHRHHHSRWWVGQPGTPVHDSWSHLGDHLGVAMLAAALSSAALSMQLFLFQTNAARGLLCMPVQECVSTLLFAAVAATGVNGEHHTAASMAAPHAMAVLGLWPGLASSGAALLLTIAAAAEGSAGYSATLDPVRFRGCDAPRPALLVRSHSRHFIFDEAAVERPVTPLPRRLTGEFQTIRERDIATPRDGFA